LNSENFASGNRKGIIYAVIVIVLGMMIFRLLYLQILHHEEYDRKSAGNSIKGIEQFPLRGVFYDRNMEVLVSNTPAYTMRILPADYDRKLSPLLDNVLEVDSGYVDAILERNKHYSRFVHVKVKQRHRFQSCILAGGKF
jgi:penicillin-binding protein 2